MVAGDGRMGSNWVWFGFDLIRHKFIDTEEHGIFTEALKMGERLVGDWRKYEVPRPKYESEKEVRGTEGEAGAGVGVRVF